MVIISPMHKVYIYENKGVPMIYDSECIKKINAVRVPTKKKVVDTFCLLVGFWAFWVFLVIILHSSY